MIPGTLNEVGVMHKTNKGKKATNNRAGARSGLLKQVLKDIDLCCHTQGI